MVLHKLKGQALVYAITLSSASCYLLFGYDQGVLGGLVAQPTFLNAIGNPKSGYLGTIVALYNVGCLLGCMLAALIGNKYGRRQMIFWGCFIMIIGAIIQTATYSAGILIAGRIISGIGNGMNTSTIPVYVSETARSKYRGSMVALQLSIVVFGTVIAYWLDYGCIKNLKSEASWRFPIAFQIVFAIITLCTILFLPETPRWLYAHDRKDEALVVLMRLMDCDEHHPEIRTIMAEMEEAVKLESSSAGFSWKHIIVDRTDLKTTRRIVLCFMIQMLQQFTGINVIALYTPVVLERNVGLSRDTSSLIAGVITLVFWTGTVPPIFLIDRYGRKKSLMWGAFALGVTITLFTIGTALNTKASNRLALAMLFCYEFSFGMSWLALPWLIAPEITPLHIRHIGGAVGPFSEWLWTFVIVQMAPSAIANTGWKIYILFCIVSFLAIPFVYFLLPETSGFTLEEIDYAFASKATKERLELQFAEAVQREDIAVDSIEVGVKDY